MLLNKKEGAGKKNNGGVLLGYDISDTCAQISYCVSGEAEAETLAVVTGTEQYNIPMVLCKRKEVNQWFFGKEAIKFAAMGEGIQVDNLLTLARVGEQVDVGGEYFDPLALLTLFVKRSLSMLGMVVPVERLGGMMFTTDKLDKRMVDILTLVAANLQLKTDNIFFQSHVESYYYYILRQPEALWTYEALLCDYDNKRLKMYSLHVNRNTTPKVVFIDVDEPEEMEREENGAEGTMEEYKKQQLDQRFLTILKGKCNGRAISSVFLIGDGYRDEWADESLRYLCRGRRVFQGNNLYSKGACYGIQEKLEEKNEKGYVFLGLDKLKANIGMKLLRHGADSYYAIMDAGINWFEAKKEFDIILESGDTVSFMLIPLNGKEQSEIRMVLEGLEQREEWTTRLRIEAEMISEEQISIRVRDMGFGEFFPSSGGEWIKIFDIG